MNNNRKILSVILALLAATFYAINTPFSKLLLDKIAPTFMASFLYLGAGIGVGIMYLFHAKSEDKFERLTKENLLYTVGMIVLDILAPIFLMIGINTGSASNASLLGNFEIVATAIIALLVFKESVTLRLWCAIVFITISSIVLSFEGTGSFKFSIGSLFVISATCCWGLENNCTRMLSQSDPKKIVIIKGIGSGLTAFLIGVFLRYPLPSLMTMIYSLCLGFVSYGLSVYYYVKAQRYLGASRTSAYYALTPFIGVILSLVLFREMPTVNFWIALVVMGIGIFFTN